MIKLPLPDIGIHSQYVVDLLEEIVDDLDEELNRGEWGWNLKDSVYSASYKLENLLQIINPELTADRDILNEVILILEKWIVENG